MAIRIDRGHADKEGHLHRLIGFCNSPSGEDVFWGSDEIVPRIEPGILRPSLRQTSTSFDKASDYWSWIDDIQPRKT